MKNTKITILKKLRNFFKALIQHIKTGMQKSSNRLIQHRYNICKGCEFFHPLDRPAKEILAQCNYCGCNLSNKKIFLNKLAWKDQKCPINKW